MASKRHLRRKACGEKQRWGKKDMQAAQYAAAVIRNRTGEAIRAYYCHFCKGIHIGHPPKREQWRLRSRT